MRASEKQMLLDLLGRITYNEKSHKLTYKRDNDESFTTGACLTVFKKDIAKLIKSFKMDEVERSNVFRPATHEYLVYAGGDNPVYRCKDIDEVFANTRGHTEEAVKQCPFTVVDARTTYRKMTKDEWCPPEQEENGCST